MNTDTADEKSVVVVTAYPGICGFPCIIKAFRSGRRMVTLALDGSECKQTQRLSACLQEIPLQELFKPITQNPVYMAAEKSGCHPSCTLPAAILKAAEVALGMALPMDVRIRFSNDTRSKRVD